MEIRDTSIDRGPGDPSGHSNVLFHAGEVKMWGDKSSHDDRRKQWHGLAADLRNVVKEAEDYRTALMTISNMGRVQQYDIAELLKQYEKDQPT